MFDCSGHPFNFQPLFDTARVQNSIGWSVLLSGILTQYEIGHFTHGGTTPADLATRCIVTDLDFDGTPYYADWPDSLTPGPFLRPSCNGSRPPAERSIRASSSS